MYLSEGAFLFLGVHINLSLNFSYVYVMLRNVKQGILYVKCGIRFIDPDGPHHYIDYGGPPFQKI